jgi:ribose transport system substrate-binding protein
MVSCKLPMGVVLILAAAAVAAGCGSSDDGSSKSASAADSGSAKTNYKITLIQGIKSDGFYGSMACGAKEAAQRLGVDLTVTGPDQFAPAQQIPLLNAVVAKKPDAILIAPTDAKALQAPLKQAAAAGIKIVLVDTTLADPSIAVSEVTSDNVGAGKNAAEELIKMMGGNGSIYVQSTAPGVTTVDARVEGFKQAVEGKTGIKNLGVKYDPEDTPEKAASIAKSLLSANSDLKGVYALNTFTAQGIATALREARKTKDVLLVGWDANESGIKALREGSAQAQVVLKPLDIGSKGVEQAVNALSGKPVEKKILTESTVATKENVDSPDVQKYLYRMSCQ